MTQVMLMPAILAGSTEAVLQTWLVKVGDVLAVGDVIAAVETEKAVVEVESEHPGTVSELLVAEGAGLEAGTPLVSFSGSGRNAESAQPEPQPASPTSNSAVAPTPRRVYASPLARKLARTHGLTLDQLTGTGPQGRIVRRDVDKVVASVAPIASGVPVASVAPRAQHQVSTQPTAAYVDEPHSRMRRIIARRLTESKQQAPHFYLTGRCLVDRLVHMRRELNEQAGVRISLNDMIVAAVARTHVLVPELNVMWTDDAIRHFDRVDVSIAVSTERGLYAPVIRDAARLSLVDLAQRTRHLRDQAEAGTLTAADLDGGTISVTNLGMFGTESFSAIINPPQSAILAVGAVTRDAIVDDGEIVAASVLRVTLSVDHRPVDGVAAARWLATFVELVEHPMRLIL